MATTVGYRENQRAHLNNCKTLFRKKLLLPLGKSSEKKGGRLHINNSPPAPGVEKGEICSLL